jgi:hypothetical protein
MEDMCSVCATADFYKSVPPGKLACGHSRYKLVPAKSRPWRSGTLSAVSESLRLAKTFVDTVTATPTLLQTSFIQKLEDGLPPQARLFDRD